MKRYKRMLLSMTFAVVLMMAGNAFGGVWCHMTAEPQGDTLLVVQLHVDSLAEFPDYVYSMEVRFSVDPTRLELDTLLFDSTSIVRDAWGGMTWGNDTSNGLCLLAGAGSVRLRDSGPVFTAYYRYKEGFGFWEGAIHWIRLSEVRLNERPAVYLGPTGIDDANDLLPDGFRLEQNYPNPFNPSTRIDFTLASAGDVTLEIYNVLGQSIERISLGRLGPGDHSYIWNAEDDAGGSIAAGVYFYRLETDEATLTRKMVLMK